MFTSLASIIARTGPRLQVTSRVRAWVAGESPPAGAGDVSGRRQAGNPRRGLPVTSGGGAKQRGRKQGAGAVIDSSWVASGHGVTSGGGDASQRATRLRLTARERGWCRGITGLRLE